jgi:hypothetical protein
LPWVWFLQLGESSVCAIGMEQRRRNRRNVSLGGGGPRRTTGNICWTLQPSRNHLACGSKERARPAFDPSLRHRATPVTSERIGGWMGGGGAAEAAAAHDHMRARIGAHVAVAAATARLQQPPRPPAPWGEERRPPRAYSVVGAGRAQGTGWLGAMRACCARQAGGCGGRQQVKIASRARASSPQRARPVPHHRSRARLRVAGGRGSES